MKTVIRTPLLLLLAALTLMALAPAFAAGTPQPVTITMYAFGNHLPSGVPSKPGPDGNTHDMLVPSDMVVQPGQQVTVKVINYDDMPHSFTAPGLKLNVIIKGGTAEKEDGPVTPATTTFTFTAPAKSQLIRWYCALPCDDEANGWDMAKSFDGQDQDGFMAGYIIVN